MEEGSWVYQYGDYREEGSYSYGYRNGYWKYFDKNGSLLFEGEFIDNNPNGKHLFYWDNGRIKDDIQYLMGRKDGDWKKYNYDGSLLLVISYENGIEQKYDGVKITPAFTEPLDSPYTEEEE
jgi:antitoxin component YwqK of YwqJK toxin-antitoxin module